MCARYTPVPLPVLDDACAVQPVTLSSYISFRTAVRCAQIMFTEAALPSIYYDGFDYDDWHPGVLCTLVTRVHILCATKYEATLDHLRAVAGEIVCGRDTWTLLARALLWICLKEEFSSAADIPMSILISDLTPSQAVCEGEPTRAQARARARTMAAGFTAIEAELVVALFHVETPKVGFWSSVCRLLHSAHGPDWCPSEVDISSALIVCTACVHISSRFDVPILYRDVVLSLVRLLTERERDRTPYSYLSTNFEAPPSDVETAVADVLRSPPMYPPQSQSQSQSLV